MFPVGLILTHRPPSRIIFCSVLYSQIIILKVRMLRRLFSTSKPPVILAGSQSLARNKGNCHLNAPWGEKAGKAILFFKNCSRLCGTFWKKMCIC